ncbi:TraB/GumN family protein [Paracoccus sp. Z330]|uniref:TraB/GumN family protein n=1 Tax=Paracoccus onchidii TaxID=3017813 RepID=A0ABT4ZCD3_9RHOB|nr:TraB/GumN family protein [Paracoccus onchidii]MDB6177028.1 TraB/GumN family protein [Paracoccus onchidii]
MRVWLGAAAVFLGLGGAGNAGECIGSNLFEQMPPEQRNQIEDAVRDVPYHEGLFWRASKGDQVITLVGTYHFGDPRHADSMARIDPFLSGADVLLVEAGPEEEQRLTHALTEDPTLMVDNSGPTLPERLPPEEWQALTDAMSQRGTPAVVTAKLRPWYVAMLLGVSPCMMQGQAESGAAGLDHLLVDRAKELDIPVRALEPWDTVFTLFRDMTPEQEIDMIRASLPAAAYADDYAITLTDAYFGGDVWKIWEFGRFDAYRNSGLSHDEVDGLMQLAQTQLMDRRNASWIAPLTEAARDAAQQGRGVVAGFGALHLPGEKGVLRLLEQEGWSIEPLDG